MPTFEQSKYCPTCKRNVSTDKNDICKKCGTRTERGSWSTRFRILEIGGEKQKRLSGFKTKKEAQQGYIDFMSTYNPLTITNKKIFIFEELLEQYFKFCQTENDISTVYDKKSIFENFITPYFKGKNLQQLSKADYINWQNIIWNSKSEKTKEQFNWNYLTKIRGNLSTFLTYCETIYDIPNKMRTIKVPKNKSIKKEIKFWELEEFNKFISSINDIMWKTVWMTFFYTGVRFNELRALSDNDIINNEIIINKALAGKKNKGNIIKQTKNYKTINKQIPNILSQQIKLYKDWKKKNNISSKFLFGGDKPLSENCIRRQLRQDIKASKQNYITPHGFRHSYVSLLIELGIGTKVIAELIGDREEQVIKTYGHLYKNAKNKAIELLNSHVNFTFCD